MLLVLSIVSISRSMGMEAHGRRDARRTRCLLCLLHPRIQSAVAGPLGLSCLQHLLSSLDRNFTMDDEYIAKNRSLAFFGRAPNSCTLLVTRRKENHHRRKSGLRRSGQDLDGW